VKNKDVQKNFVEKLNEIRKLVAVRFPNVNMRDVQFMSKIAHYHYNKKKFIVAGQEKEFYGFLIENGYNPYTIYRWMLLESIPEDIRFQLKQHQISQKKASSAAFGRRHEDDSALALSIREMGLSLVRRM